MKQEIVPEMAEVIKAEVNEKDPSAGKTDGFCG